MATRIEDSTGKFIEAAEDAAEVLKGLVASLKGGTKITSGGDKLAEQLSDLAKTSEKDAEKLRKAIEDLPKEFVDTFTKEIGDVGDLLEDIRDFSKDLAKKRSGDGGLDKKDLNPMEKMMAAVRTATEKTERIFGKKGSGYTHDIYCEKLLKQANRLLSEMAKRMGASPGKRGRAGGGPPSPLDATPSTGLLDPSAGAGFLDPSSAGGDPLHIGLDDAVASAEVLGTMFPTLVSSAEALVGSLNRVHRNSKYWASDLQVIADHGANIATEMDRISMGVDDTSKEYAKLINKHEKESDILNQVANIWGDLSALDKARMKGMIKQLQALKATGATAETVREEYDKMLVASRKLVKNHHMLWGSLKTMGDAAKHLAGQAAAIGSGFMGAAFLKTMFDGLQESVEQLSREAGRMRSLMVDKAWAGPGEYFNELFEVTDDIVQRLGQAPVLIRRAWITNIKKGVRNLEDMKETLNAGLALSTAIGSNAEATTDEFQKWNMQLGFSGRQTAVLARNVRQTAASVGLMGDEMLKAVSAARELAQEMRNAGFNADQAADGIVRMTAAGQKFGVDAQVQELVRATSGGLDSYIAASAEMRNLIAQSGQTQRVVRGEAMTDPANQRQTMMGVADMLKEEFRRMGAVNAQGNVDTSRLSPQQVSQMNMILRRRFGRNMGMGESARMIEAIEDANLTTDEKMAKLNRQMSTNNNLTAAEKTAIEAQLKILEEQKKQERNTALVNSIDRINTAMREGSPAEAMAAMQRTLETEARNAQARGVAMSTDISRTMSDSIGSVNERLKKAGKQELNQGNLMMRFERARAANDVAGMREVMGEISAGNQLADTQLRQTSNVQDNAQQSMFRAQAQIQGLAGTAVQLLGSLPIAVIWLAAIASTLLGLGYIKSLLSSLLGSSDSSNGLLGKVKQYGMQTYQMFAKRGSGYTHDIYVVTEIRKLHRTMSKMADRKALGGAGRREAFDGRVNDRIKNNRGLSELQGRDPARAQMVARNQQKFDDKVQERLKNDPRLIETARTDPRRAEAMAKAQVKHDRKQMLHDRKMMKNDIGDNKAKGRLMRRESGLLDRASKGSKGGAKAADKKKGGGGLLDMIKEKMEMPSFEMPKNMKKLGGDLLKGAVGLALLVTGIVALAVVIMTIAGAIIKFSGLTFEKALDIGKTTAAILIAAGLIAAACVGAAYGLKMLNDMRDTVKISDIYKGAAVLLVLTPAMMLLGLVIVGMGAILNSFMSAEEAGKIALGVAAIMLSAGLISAGVLLGAASLAGLGLLIPFAKILVPLMFAGAIALFILTPAMILMALAILGLSKAVSSMVDVGWAEGVAKSVGAIMISAGLIAAGVLLGAAALAGLGLLVPFANVLVPLMFAGAIALFILTPAMIKMAHAIIGIAAGVSSGIDVGWAASVSEKVASIMWSAAKIAGSVVLLAGITTVLGVMSLVAPLVAIAMWLGAGALLVLMPSMIKLAQVIISMAAKMMEGVDPAAAEATAKSLASFMESTRKVVSEVMLMSGIASLLGALIFVAPFMSIAMLLGAGTLGILTGALVVFGRAVMNIGSRMASEVDMAQMENARKAMEAMATMARTFGSTVDVLAASILPMVAKPILGLWGSSMADKLTAAIQIFTGPGGMLHAVIGFFTAIKEKLVGAGFDNNIAASLDAMAAVIDKLKPVLDRMQGTLQTLVQSNYGRDSAKIWSSAMSIAWWFQGIATALKTGFIEPIKNDFPNENEVKDIASRLEGMTTVMGLLDPVLNKLGEVTNKWVGGWWWDSPLRDMRNKAQDFGYFFGGIGSALRYGVIEPIKKYFPDVSEVNAVTTTLQALTESMTALSETLLALADVTSNMKNLDLDPVKIGEMQGVLQALAGQQGGDITMPISTSVATGGGMPVEQQKKEETWWSSMLGVLTGIGSPQTSPSAGLGRVMKGSMDQSLGQPITKMGSGIETIGSGNADLGAIIRASSLALGEQIVNAVNAHKSETVTAIRAIHSVSVAPTGRTGTATPANPPTPTTAATGTGAADLDERVERRVAEARPSGAMAAMNEELVKISTNTEMLVQLAQERNEMFEKLLEKFDAPPDAPAGGGEGGTALNTRPRGAPNYYQWRQARYGDGPTKQYNNPGI